MAKERFFAAVRPYWEEGETRVVRTRTEEDDRRTGGSGDDDPRPAALTACQMKELRALKAELVALKESIEAGGREKKPERSEPAHMPVNSWMAA